MAQGKTLSRDYKHVKRHTPGGDEFSGWVGLVAGLAIGLTVALGVYLHYHDQPPAEPRASTEPPASSRVTEDAPPPSDPAKDLTFEDRVGILNHFFKVNFKQFIEPSARYSALLLKKGMKPLTGTALKRVVKSFTNQDFLDLQVLFERVVPLYHGRRGCPPARSHH